MSEWINFVPSGRDLIGMGSIRGMIFLFFSFCMKKASFRHFRLGPFKTSPLLFCVGGFFGSITSKETTGLS